MSQSPDKSRATETVQTYVFHDPLRDWVKIGRSVDPGKRLRTLESATGAALSLLATLGEDCEAALHRRLTAARVRGEWFRVTDEVRTVVAEIFGCVVPAATAQVDEALVARRRVIADLEQAWGIPLVPPSVEWFVSVADWLADEYGLSQSDGGMEFPTDDAMLGCELYDLWPDWIVSVGGEPGDSSLGIVLADRPAPSSLHSTLSQWFWTVDGYTTLHVAVASDPPQSRVEALISSAAA